MSSRVIVIGAGIGGLSAAIRLAASGFTVTVYETNDRVGGKMSEIESGGFRWDTGPSVITMRHVLEDTFSAAGRVLSDYVTLLPIDPLTSYFWLDRTRLDVSADTSVMSERIASIAPGDVDGYLRYLEYAAQIHRVTGPVFIYDQPPRPSSFLKVPLTDWLVADPFRTMDAAIRSYVRSPKLRQVLGRFATYVGGSPYQAPATLNVIADVELSGGVWYPQGGVYAYAAALERLARELGIGIVTNCGVASIACQDGRVAGVVLETGAEVSADAVISNLDVTTTYMRLLPKSGKFLSRLKRLQAFEPSCSAFIMLLGVESVTHGLSHHNILFSDDYAREFRQIFREGVPADQPTVYIAITSKTDPAHAPSGSENWFVLVNAPALTPESGWATVSETYAERVLNMIEAHGLTVRNRIRAQHVLTPDDLQTMTGAHRGALYGASANSRFTAFRRPHNRCPDLRGLYFAGGTTHPGGGVPMVTLSGKVAAELVKADLS